MRYLFSGILGLCITLWSTAQVNTKQFKVQHINSTIVLDGELNESDWQMADGAKDFWQYFPSDNSHASQQTIIKMLYDDTNLYIGIKNFSAGKNYVVQSLKRDYRAGGNDNISLMFDTFNDGSNAFLFGINPVGVRREALISGGGVSNRGFNTAWDVKWKGKTKIYDNYYTAEMIIPLSSFKFKEGTQKWRFNSYRFDTQSNEQSTWINIPRNQLIFSLAYMGEMIFEKPLKKSKSPIAIIPYVNTQGSKDFVNDTDDVSFKAGVDAKIAIGNSMNLDLTLNPDFSQVEVDDQITNLTRFEISLPEKRQFFIDNSDLFGSFGGARDANPFFSRRIGIAHDLDNNTIENKILAGARLSGKLNEDWRLGFLNVVTEEDLDNRIPLNNNTVFALQRKVFSRSSVSLFAINRQALKDYNFLDQENEYTTYNRVIGMDYNIASSDNTWNGKIYAHKSFRPTGGSKDFSTGAFLEFNNKKINAFADLVYIGGDFKSDLGFVRRTDILKAAGKFDYQFWPEDGIINNHRLGVFSVVTWRPDLDMQRTDYMVNAIWEGSTKNQSRFDAQITNRYVYLTNGFDPSRSENGVALPDNSEYTFTYASMKFRSDRRKAFSFSVSPEIGKFFNGHKYSLTGDLFFRVQPKFLASIRMNYDRIELPEPYSSGNIWLIGPKIDVTFNKSVFWSTFIQYSNQSDNLGINSRLQWRFAPLSDLFLVYNDNYFVNSFEPKVRSINLKLTYWLNI